MPAAHWAWIVAALPLACSIPRSGSAGAVWSYEATLEQEGAELRLQASFPPGPALALTVAPAALRFLADVRSAERGELAASGGVWTLPASDRARSVSWRFHARDAARAIDDSDLAAWRGLGFLGSLSSFLLCDPEGAAHARFVLRVNTASGLAFACSSERDGDAWAAAVQELAVWPACAFGPIGTRSDRPLPDEDLELTLVEMEPRDTAHTKALLRWSRDAATGVAAYFRKFPVERLLLVVVPNHRPRIGDGRTRGSGGATIQVAVSLRAGPEQFRDDWVLTHEMIHLGLPSLPRPNHWLEEGSATYLEPILR